MKPDNRMGLFKFYYDLLFDYPFGGVEVQNTRTIMDLISEEYSLRPTKVPRGVGRMATVFPCYTCRQASPW